MLDMPLKKETKETTQATASTVSNLKAVCLI